MHRLGSETDSPRAQRLEVLLALGRHWKVALGGMARSLARKV